MSITTQNDCAAYLSANGARLPQAILNLIDGLRLQAENLVKEHVGYEIEQATYTEFHPVAFLNTRQDGDIFSQGFDFQGGTVVPRQTFPMQRRELSLLQLPVRSIQSIYDNPSAYNTPGGYWDASSLLPPNTYYIDFDDSRNICMSGIVYRYVGSWGVEPRTIQVNYTAGFTANELATRYTGFAMAVKVAVAQAIANAYNRARAAMTGVIPTNVSIKDFSAGFSPQAIGVMLGAGISCSALPTESMQYLANYVSMRKNF